MYDNFASKYGFDSVLDIVTTNKTVFLRCDFENTISESGIIINEKKILRSLLTINYLIKTGARVVVFSNIGQFNDENYLNTISTKIIADFLDESLRTNVYFSKELTGEEAKKKIFRIDYGEVMVMENLSFYNREKKGDISFAAELSDGMNLYINDSFEQSNNNFSSIVYVPIFIRPCAGLCFIEDFMNAKNHNKEIMNAGLEILKRLSSVFLSY